MKSAARLAQSVRSRLHNTQDSSEHPAPEKASPTGRESRRVSPGLPNRRSASLIEFSAKHLPHVFADARKFLNDLRKATQALGKLVYSNDPEVAPKNGEEGCVAATMVTVALEKDPTAMRRPIDANVIEFTDHDLSGSPRTYIAGRSPTSLKTHSASPPDDQANFVEFEKCLVQGIESRQGIFQFVGQRAHDTPEQSFDKPIIYQLLAMQGSAEARDSELWLGGRYQVKNLSVLTTNDAAGMHDHCHYRLEVLDTATNGTVTVPLTQAALPFDEGIFQIPEIIRAGQLCAAHNGFVTGVTPEEARQQTFAAVFSKKGVIRNATTLTYFDLSKRIGDRSIKDEQELDIALLQAIVQGRKARGIKKFIPSTRQVALLRSALVEKLQQREASENISGRNQAARAESAEELATAQPEIPAITFGQSCAVNAARTRPFSKHAFEVRDNTGGGSCLFHALEGTAEEPMLDTEIAIPRIRERVAAVLETDQSDQGNTEKARRVRRGNYWKVLSEFDRSKKHDIKNFQSRNSDGKILEEVSNERYAECQKMLNFYAGDDEIQQWLSLEENQNKKIVVIDIDNDNVNVNGKKIVTFKFGQKPQITKLEEMPDNETEVSNAIAKALAPALEQERLQTQPPTEIALYRSSQHFARIIGHHDVRQTNQAYHRWHAATEQEFIAAKNVDISTLR